MSDKPPEYARLMEEQAALSKAIARGYHDAIIQAYEDTERAWKLLNQRQFALSTAKDTEHLEAIADLLNAVNVTFAEAIRTLGPGTWKRHG